MRDLFTFVKLFLCNLFVMVVVIGLASVVTYRQLDARYQREMRENQDRLAHVAVANLQELWPLEPARIDRICKALLHDPAMRLTAIAADGAVLGDSEADPAKMVNHRTKDRPEVMDALSGKAGSHERKSETLNIPFRYVAVPLKHNGKVAAAVRLAVPVEVIAGGEAFIRNTVILSAAAGSVAAALLGMLASWLWYAPMRRITQTAHQVACGEFPTDAGPAVGAKLTELAEALSQTHDSLADFLGRIAIRYEDHQSVLAGLPEGVVATDVEDRVVLMNPAAGALLSAQPAQAVGKQFASVVRSMEILEFHEHALAGDRPLCKGFDLDGPAGRRSVEVYAARIPPGASSVRGLIILRDVTEPARV
jgi:two-component system, OmpR family, phosphate regulon sensor histidine kinase PhoR